MDPYTVNLLLSEQKKVEKKIKKAADGEEPDSDSSDDE
jgi:hypothetical protein